MTDPSPQEELRAKMAAILRLRSTDGVVEEHLKLLLPLFAARVAAIEQDNERLRRNAEVDFNIIGGFEAAAVDWKARAERAEAVAEYVALHKRSTFDERTQRAEKAEAELAALTAERDRLNAELIEFTGVHDRIVDKLQADLTAAQERLVALSTACRDGNRGCCVDGTCCACCDRAQRAEQRVAAERKQAAAEDEEADFSIPPHAFTPGNAASPNLNERQCGFPHVFADGPDYCCLEKFHLLHRWGRGSEINP